MKTIITYGTFDLLHAGHVNHLRRARGFGDRLVVGLSTDAFCAVKGKDNVHSYEDRKVMLESIRFVDEVIPETCEEQKAGDIARFRAAVFAMGCDWEGKFDYLAVHCEVVYLPRPECLSTTKIKEVIRAHQIQWLSRTDVINEVIRWTCATTYLEIGYGTGENFTAIRCHKKWSVDPANADYPQARPTHRMTSDAFFEINQEMFDVVFIDGLHHADQVWRDIQHALAALTPRGVIVVHDLNPITEEMQRVPRIRSVWTGDGWRAWVGLREQRPDLACVVVEADYGIGVIIPGAEPGPEIGNPPVLPPIWEDFRMNRHDWLHLLPPAEARKFVKERIFGRNSTTNI